MKNVKGWWLPDEERYFIQFIADRKQRQNEFQRDHLLAAFDHVTRWDCAIDCGAHIGFWTYDMAQKFKRVHAFEPAADTFECLQKNVAEFHNVSLYRMAVGATFGECSIVEDRKRIGNTGSRFTCAGGRVPMTYLDAMDIDDCGLLKVDVEGYEYHVLKGARGTIERCKPVVIMETDKKFAKARYGIADNAAMDWLLSIGYSIAAEMRPDKVFIPPR